jgi:SAM-dependent methyltransferase
VADASVDVVLALTVLYHLDDDALAVREIARVLRPGGVVVLLEPAFPILQREHDALTHGVRRYRRKGLERLATDAGLQVTRSTYAKSLLFVPAAAIALVQRFGSRRDRSEAPRSDLEPRRIDRVATPIARRLADAETRFLRRRRLPFGTSVVVVARRHP